MLKRFYFATADEASGYSVEFKAPAGMGFSKFVICSNRAAFMSPTAESFSDLEMAVLPEKIPVTFDFSGDVYSLPSISVLGAQNTSISISLTVFEYGSKPNVNAFLSEE